MLFCAFIFFLSLNKISIGTSNFGMSKHLAIINLLLTVFAIIYTLVSVVVEKKLSKTFFNCK